MALIGFPMCLPLLEQIWTPQKHVWGGEPGRLFRLTGGQIATQMVVLLFARNSIGVICFGFVLLVVPCVFHCWTTLWEFRRNTRRPRWGWWGVCGVLLHPFVQRLLPQDADRGSLALLLCDATNLHDASACVHVLEGVSNDCHLQPQKGHWRTKAGTHRQQTMAPQMGQHGQKTIPTARKHGTQHESQSATLGK